MGPELGAQLTLRYTYIKSGWPINSLIRSINIFDFVSLSFFRSLLLIHIWISVESRSNNVVIPKIECGFGGIRHPVNDGKYV